MQEATDEPPLPIFSRKWDKNKPIEFINVSKTPISSPVKPEVMAGDCISCSLVFHLCVRYKAGKNDIIILRSEGEECTVDVSVLPTHCKPLHTHTHLKPGGTVGLPSVLLRNTVICSTNWQIYCTILKCTVMCFTEKYCHIIYQ